MVAAAAIAAAVVRGIAAATHVAAAAEQDEQDDDPQAVVATEAVVIHKITSRRRISEQLHRSFHVMTDPDFGDSFALCCDRRGRPPGRPGGKTLAISVFILIDLTQHHQQNTHGNDMSS